MYKKIKKQKTTLSLYTDGWSKTALIPEGEIEDMKAAFQAHLNEEFEAGKDYKPNKADWLDGKWSHLDRRKEEYQRGETAIAPETLAEVGTALSTAPDTFPLHKTVGRLLDAKAQMFETGEGFRLGHRRALAFGSLLTEGYPSASQVKTHARHLLAAPLGFDQPRNRRALLPAQPHPRRPGAV